MFLTGFNDYEYDRFQNLTIRFVAGSGPGVKAVKSENIKLDFDAGIDYQRENFLNGLNRNSAEANFGDTLSYQVTDSIRPTLRAAATKVDGTRAHEPLETTRASSPPSATPRQRKRRKTAVGWRGVDDRLWRSPEPGVLTFLASPTYRSLGPMPTGPLPTAGPSIVQEIGRASCRERV